MDSGEFKRSNRLIRVKEHKTRSSLILLEIQLCNPRKLNVLNLEMILSLNKLVKTWKHRKDLSALFIHSEGEGAFCAGGDVAQMHSLILSARKQTKDPALSVKSFFKTEYETNYELYRFPKPVVLWGDGVVMGGGMGLFMSSSHPVLTENSLLSMPEICIGFFPDVGASYFLNQIKNNLGLYLALTACRLNAAEAYYLNLSPWAFWHQDKQNILDFLTCSSFQNQEDFEKKFRKFYKKPDFLEGQNNWIKKFEKEIVKIIENPDMDSVYKAFLSSKKEDKKWEQNRSHFLKASPTSLALIFEQIKRAKKQTNLKSLFETELSLALHLASGKDFTEGVRALLIDKDKTPKWKPKHIKDLDFSKIQDYFQPLDSWNCFLDV